MSSSCNKYTQPWPHARAAANTTQHRLTVEVPQTSVMRDFHEQKLKGNHKAYAHTTAERKLVRRQLRKLNAVTWLWLAVDLCAVAYACLNHGYAGYSAGLAGRVREGKGE